jgi:hypothetical protein
MKLITLPDDVLNIIFKYTIDKSSLDKDINIVLSLRTSCKDLYNNKILKRSLNSIMFVRMSNIYYNNLKGGNF